MAHSIRSAATNHYQLSLAVLYESAGALFSDERLSSINPAAHESLEKYVTFILLKGSPIQRAALIDNLDYLADISMPELKVMPRPAATSLLQTYIMQTCSIMGCSFNGDIQVAVSFLYDDYGGMSIIEWARFFHYIPKGHFQNEYQSINSRGLNVEFLRDWLDQFYERRDNMIASLRKQMVDVPDTSGEYDAAGFEKLKQIRIESLTLDSEVHNWRVEYENSLTSKSTMIIEMDLETGESTTQVVPVIEDNDDAAYTRLRDFLFLFYAFGKSSVDIKQIIVDMTANWELERVIDFPDTEQKSFYRSRSKMLLSSLRNFCTIELCRNFLGRGVKTIAEQYPLTKDFYTAITGKPYSGENLYVSILPHLTEITSKLISEFHACYPQDVRISLKSGFYPLYRDEYVCMRCIHWSVTVANIEHPFIKICNIDD